MSSSFICNGVSIQGLNSGSRIILDGVDVTAQYLGQTKKKIKRFKLEIVYMDGEEEKDIVIPPCPITFAGTVENAKVSNPDDEVRFYGDVGSATVSNGSIKVAGDVKGSATASNGDVNVGGSVKGQARASNGNVIYRKNK